MNEELIKKWNEIKNKCIMAIVVLRFVYIRAKQGGWVELEEMRAIENNVSAIILLTEHGFVRDVGGNFSITENGIEAVKYQESLSKRG